MKTSIKSKILSFTLALTMVISLMSTFAIPTVSAEGITEYWTDPGNYDLSWYGDGTATTYTISTAEQLAGLSVIVNELNGVTRDNFTGKTINLTNSIDLSGKMWTTIGGYRFFNGTFDGHGKTIKGIHIDSKSHECQGLFSVIEMDSVIKNVSVNGNIKGQGYVGGVVGYTYGKIENCSNTGTVTGSIAGGIVGGTAHYGLTQYYTVTITIKNCYNTGTVNGNGNGPAGGIVGYTDYTTTIANCYNTGTVTSNGSVGGIVGVISMAGKITNCYNTGTVNGERNVGGIVGEAQSIVPITNCYNTGTVTGENNVAGIVGSSFIQVIITNCYNVGPVSGENYVGGISGLFCFDTKYSNCYYIGYKGGIGQDYYLSNPTDIPVQAESFIKIVDNPVKPKYSTKISEKTLANLPAEFKNAFGITAITMPASYSSSDTSKATVSNRTTIRALSEGTSTISSTPLIITQKALTATGFDGEPVTVSGKYSEELSISDKGFYLEADAHYIAVANKLDQAPIKNAQVYIDDQLYTANEDGYVKYKGKFGEHTVKVKADGYNTKTLLYNFNRGESRFFFLDKSSGDNKPYVTMLLETAQGKDLLNQTLFYVEGNNDSCKLQIDADWGGKTPSKYVIYQDSTKKYESTSKKIDFAPGKVFSNTKPVYLKLVSTDGTESVPIKIGMSIHKRSAADDIIGDINDDINNTKFKIADSQSGKVDDSDVTQIFPGDFKFELSPIDLSISAKLNTEDGSRTIKGVLGFGSQGSEVGIIDNRFTSKSEWESFKKNIEDLKKANYNKDELKKSLDKISKKYTQLSYSTVNVSSYIKGDIKAVGYFEQKIDKNGKVISTSGGLIADAYVSATYGGSFLAGPVPVYYDITGKLSAEVKAEIGYTWTDKKPTFKSELTLTPEIILGAGVGIKGVASVGIEGGAKLKCKIIPEAEGTLTPYANIRITALFIFDYTWEIASKDFKLWPQDGAKSLNEALLNNASSMYNSNGEANDSPQFNWMSQDFASQTSAWNGGNKLAMRGLAVGDNFLTLQDNILPTSEPQFVQLGNKLVMTFQAVDTTRAVGNSTVLMYSYYENGVWSEPSPVWDTKTSDMYANMLTVNNEVYLVWQKAKTSIASDNVQTAMSELCKNSEIGFAKWDNVNNTFTEQQFITNDDTMDSLPIVTSDGTKLTAVWANNKDNIVYGVENGYSIMKSDFDGKSWTPAEVIDTVKDNLVELTAGYDNGELTVAYSSALKENPTYTDVYCIKGAQKVKLTESTSVNSGLQYVSGKLFWQSNGVINTCSNGVISKITVGDQTAVPASYKLVHNSKKTAITWVEQKDGVYSINASIPDGDGWSNPISLFSLDKVKYPNTSIEDFDAVLSEDGSWKIIMKTQMDTNTSLAFVDVNVPSDISLDYVSALNIDRVDMIQSIDCYITNNGESDIENYSIDIVDEQGTQYAHEDIKLTIKPGKTEIIPIKIDLNQIKASTKLLVSIQSSSDMNTENNSYTITLGHIDISLDVERYEIDNNLIVSALVQNNSAIGSDTTIKLIEGTEDGIVVDVKQIGLLDNLQSYNYNFTIDKSKIDFHGQDMKKFYLKVESDKDDPYLDDNTFVILVYNDINEKVTGVTLSNSEVNMKVAESFQLQATISPENATNKNVSWSSLDPTIASVSNEGIINALKEGKTTVIAKTDDGDFISECVVTVVDDHMKEKCEITYSVTSSWGNYKSVSVKITNTGNVPIEAWSVDFVSSGQITQIWDASFGEKVNNQYSIHCMPYNAIIPTNSSVEFGMIVLATDLNEDSFKLREKIVVPANDKVNFGFNIINDWNLGFFANIALTNLTDKPINNWELTFNANFDIESMWPYSVKKNEDGSYSIKGVCVPINGKSVLNLEMQGKRSTNEKLEISNVKFVQINP